MYYKSTIKIYITNKMFCLNTEEKTIVKYTNNKWIIIIIDIYVDIFFERYAFFLLLVTYYTLMMII